MTTEPATGPATGPATATVPRARRLAPDERREEIIQAAARLFEQRPWSQVSTVDIAREAGIARGLLNHYFGDKRGLYLAVVRRWLLLPAPQVVPEELPAALPDRVDIAVGWFLDSVASQAASHYAVFGTEGVADDLEVAAILGEADDLAARRTLQLVGLDDDDALARAQVRAFGGLAKATAKEWARRGALTRWSSWRPCVARRRPPWRSTPTGSCARACRPTSSRCCRPRCRGRTPRVRSWPSRPWGRSPSASR